jgi:PST family polysaccharide transporter
VYYAASNFDKVLIGRYLGIEALGLYGRAYQLMSIPSDNLNTAAGEVAFSALSRVQTDAAVLRNYFLKGYSLLLTLTVPLTVACGAFSVDVIGVFLGAKWTAVAPIFRLLAPAMLVFAIVNPLGWVLTAMGRVGRGLKMALVLAPLMITAYVAGLPYGASGVAAAYSIVMLLWVLPAIAWVVHDTPLSVRDILVTISRPLGASGLGAACAVGLRILYGENVSPFPRLVLESAVLFAIFAGTLLFPMRQRAFFMDVIRPWTRRASSAEEPSFAKPQSTTYF